MAWTKTPMANVIKLLNDAVGKLVEAEAAALKDTAARVEALTKNISHRQTLRTPPPPTKARRR